MQKDESLGLPTNVSHGDFATNRESAIYEDRRQAPALNLPQGSHDRRPRGLDRGEESCRKSDAE